MTSCCEQFQKMLDENYITYSVDSPIENGYLLGVWNGFFKVDNKQRLTTFPCNFCPGCGQRKQEVKPPGRRIVYT